MRCRDVELLLGELQEGRLEAPSELRMHAHLEECAACREHVARWRALTPALRAAVPPSPSPMRLRRMEVEIERRLLHARADRPIARRTLRWATAGAVLAVAAALAVMLRPVHPVRPPVKSAPPFATVVGRSGAASVGAGESLASGARVSLPEEAEVSMQLTALAKLHLVGPAVLVLGGDALHVQLRLESGRLEAEVAHRRAAETFVISMPDGRVEVRGTRFVVVASPTGSSVRVDEGRVAVFDAKGTEHAVANGELFSIQPEPAGPVLAVPIAAPVPPPPDECHAPKLDCTSIVNRTRGAMRAGNYAGALAVLEPALRPASGACARRPIGCADEMGYLRAESLRLAGNLDAAVRAYHALDRASASPAMRQNALYAAAQLDRRLHRLSEARAAFERALAVFPAGPLREEALLGAMETADESGDRIATEAAAHRYLESFPAGIGAARARRLEARALPNPAP